MKICPNCKNVNVRHKGKKVTKITGTRNNRDFKVTRSWTEKGYVCKKCGWESAV